MSQANTQPPVEEKSYTRNAIIISAITAVLMGLLLVYLLFTGSESIIAIPTAILLTLTAVASAILSHYGRSTLGIILLVGSILVANIFISFFISGLSLVLTAVAIVLTIGIVANTLPSRLIGRVIVVAAALGVVAILADVFGSPNRAGSSSGNVSNIILIVTLVVYGVAIIRQFPKISLRAKLISATATVAIIAVTTVTLLVGTSTRNALVNQVGVNLNSLATSQSLAVGELMHRQISTLESLALSTALRNALRARNTYYANQSEAESQAGIQNANDRWQTADDLDSLVLSVLNNSTSGELKTFSQSFPDHLRLILTDEFGAVVAASQRPSQYSFANENWWENAYASGSVYISEPYADSDFDEIVIDFALPIRTETNDGRTIIGGILISTYQLSALADIIVNTGQGQNLNSELFFQDGWELEVESGEETLTYEFKQLQEGELVLLQEISGSETLYFHGEIDDISSLLSMDQVNTLGQESEVDQLGWQVAVSQAEEVALAPVAQQQRLNIVLGIIIVFLASVTAAIVGQYLTRPITRLTETAVKVTEGDLSARAEVETNDEIGTLAVAFNTMTNQLQESIQGLEQSIAERTHALTASIEVSRSLSTILDPTKLVEEVVEQVRAAFDYYYVQIYLLSESGRTLQMAGGTGEAGQVMLARQHKLNMGQGLVGQAAATNSPIFIPDVSQSPDWQSNPLLPDTKAEITVPIVIANKVFGVLDVQHDVTDGLTEEDIALLQSVANQVAIAIQNARSFEATRSQAEREATINAINQKIQRANSVNDVLRIAATELGHVLNNHKASVQLFNPVHRTNGDDRNSS